MAITKKAREVEKKRLKAECLHLPDYQLCEKCYNEKWENFGSTPKTNKERGELIDAIFGRR